MDARKVAVLDNGIKYIKAIINICTQLKYSSITPETKKKYNTCFVRNSSLSPIQ